MNRISLRSVIPAGLVGLALLGLFYLLGGCGNAPAVSKTNPDSQTSDVRIVVRTAPVQQQSISLPIHASGILGSSAEQRLAFKIGGVIQRIYVDEGDVVRPGQLLAVLDKTEIDAQVAQA
ncbi:MAG: biotin/lipoyl-binding protein, partial [Saprospiraceae bacterium]|nr:biotin/lipoyl-binding protein [Saprospiraceae bacterium]